MAEGFTTTQEMLENPDHEEELYLQSAMAEMMLESDDEGDEDEGAEGVDSLSDGDVELVEVEPEINTKKTPKQSQITDFFVKPK